MEAATATPATPEAPQEAPDVERIEAAAELAAAGPDKPETAKQMFRYSAWVHLGPGAEDCEDVHEGSLDHEGNRIPAKNECTDEMHFHAWCRMPNQFEHKEMRDKGNAARARKIRQLHDPGTDAYDILEGEIDQIRRGDAPKELAILELTNKEWWTDYIQAQRDVIDLEEDGPDGEPVKPFQHFEDDQRRFNELRAMAPEDRPSDEFDELTRHLERYNELVEAKTEELQQPRKDAFEQMDLEPLLDSIKKDRIDSEANEEFLHVYNSWQWFLGTLVKPPHGQRRFSSIEALMAAPVEAVEELQRIYTDLELTRQRGLQGNS